MLSSGIVECFDATLVFFNSGDSLSVPELPLCWAQNNQNIVTTCTFFESQAAIRRIMETTFLFLSPGVPLKIC